MKIVIIGCGTSGNVIIPQLKEHKLFLIDRDIVEEKNLSYQKLFTKKDVGKPKAEVLGKRLQCPYKIMDVDYTNISSLKADLIIDCTDNLETRFLINEYCHKKKFPWIYTGLVASQGRMMSCTGEFCFRCVFSEVKGLETCATAGVDVKMANKLASVVKEEVQRIEEGKFSRGLWANASWIHIQRNTFCSVCKGKYPYLEGKKERIIKFCGSSRYQFKGNFDFTNVKKRLHGKGSWFIYEDFYIFPDRVLVKASSEKEAKKKFAKVIGC